MDAPILQGEDGSMIEMIPNEDSASPEVNLMSESLKREIERALTTLTPREADVIRLYFGLTPEPAMTLEEIGDRFELTRERVRQIKEKAIRRLKHASRSKILKAYLG
jgi:RNA polymerase primary sigma factor